MTVITTLISRHCIVQASDSFITKANSKGSFDVVQSQETKLIRVPQHRGILAYWGLATSDYYNWSTLNWLQKQVALDKSKSAEDFAFQLTEQLNQEISRLKFKNRLTTGIVFILQFMN